MASVTISLLMFAINVATISYRFYYISLTYKNNAAKNFFSHIVFEDLKIKYFSIKITFTKWKFHALKYIRIMPRE